MRPINIDADPNNADWPKRTWDIAFSKEEFRAFFRTSGMTPQEFRGLPAYRAQDRPVWVDEVLDEAEEQGGERSP